MHPIPVDDGADFKGQFEQEADERTLMDVGRRGAIKRKKGRGSTIDQGGVSFTENLQVASPSYVQLDHPS